MRVALRRLRNNIMAFYLMIRGKFSKRIERYLLKILKYPIAYELSRRGKEICGVS